MKRLIYSLVIVAALFAPQHINAGNTSITTKGDTTIVVANGDTAVITSRVAGLVEKIISNELVNHLDDTLVGSEANPAENHQHDDARTSGLIELNRYWSSATSTITQGLLTGIVAIVLLVLFFRYLNRRRKYKVLEKAIENNYPLPDGALGNGQVTRVVYNFPNAPAAPVQGQPVEQGIPAPPPFRSYDNNTQQPQPQPQPQPQYVYPYNINWGQIKGIPTFAVGVAGIIFFALAGAGPVAAVFLIPLIIGGAKMFSSYMEQKHAIQQAICHQAMQQPHVAQQQPAQQPAQPADNNEQNTGV